MEDEAEIYETAAEDADVEEADEYDQDIESAEVQDIVRSELEALSTELDEDIDNIRFKEKESSASCKVSDI